MRDLFLIVTIVTTVLFSYSCSDNDKKNGPELTIGLSGTTTINLTPGTNTELPVLFSFSPSAGIFDKIEYRVEDLSVAKPVGDFIKFIGNGETTVRAVGNDGEVISPAVTVICSSPVTEIGLVLKSLSVGPAESVMLSDYFTVFPKTASDSGLEYEIEDESVAKAENGRLSFVSVGNTTITAYATDGSGVSSTQMQVKCVDTPNIRNWGAKASTTSTSMLTNSLTQERYTPEASCAVDGDPGTTWQSGSSYSSFRQEWLMLDMIKAKNIRSVTVTDALSMVLEFDVYVSAKDEPALANDDESFEKVGSGLPGTAVTFGAVNARHVKIVTTKGTGSFIFYSSISNVEIE